MRKNGWQLPYHPLQVVAVAVFLALGFAYYVFFAPFVGKKMVQYIFMGLYTPLITCCFGLYIWCAAADPADPGVFRSKKYLNIPDSGKPSTQKEFKLGGESTSSLQDFDGAKVGEKPLDNDALDKDGNSKASVADTETKDTPRERSPFLLLACFAPCAYVCKCSGSSRESSLHMSEDGMFYCSLCEVEVFKYSKHCRVCDKCVDRFDHHCRWLNNCIGRRNYRQFFTLMVSAILLLILQWVTGLFVLICCFIERKRFNMEIATKLGSSFSLVPFVLVVALCTLLAMIATLPLAQLFFFHILLIKKGISTYDYIVALREQEQEHQGVGGQQSPQMSPASSLTGLSSASSFTTFNRGAWCTPPRLFLEDQFDVVPPETGSVSSLGKKAASEEPSRKKNPAAVKISPWKLARLNAEEISRVAAEARKRSKILQPVAAAAAARRDADPDGSFGRRMFPRPENNNNNNNRRRGGSKRVRLPAEQAVAGTPSSSSLAPLQLEALSAFQTGNAGPPGTAGMVRSSPESSLDSPDIHPFRVSSSGAEDGRRLTSLSAATAAAGGQYEFPLSRSTSDGYEASGGEDSDRVPSRFVQRSTNWSNAMFSSEPDDGIFKLKASSSSSTHAADRSRML